MYNEVHKKNLSLNLSNFKLYFIKEKKMTNYIFLLELYFILTVLTFLYPKALQKRNHIINGILMGFFLVLLELILFPAGFELSFSELYNKAIMNMPKVENMNKFLEYMPIVKEKFIFSILLPLGFFIIGRVLYSLNKISINTFDTIFTGLFPFVVYFDFVIFLGVKGLGAYLMNYIVFFLAYAFSSYARIEMFMFFGIKNIIDDIELNRVEG